MKSSLAGRLDRLEETINPHGIMVLSWDGAESRETCIRRHGFDPADRRMTFILADEVDLRA
jgi:hypothetical protein